MPNITGYLTSVAIKQGDIISIIDGEIEATGRQPIGIAMNDAKPGQRVQIMIKGLIHLEMDASELSPVYFPPPTPLPTRTPLDLPPEFWSHRKKHMYTRWRASKKE